MILAASSFLFGNRAGFLKLLTKFRGGLLKLECNVGRFNNIPFNERLCRLCKADVEMNFMFCLFVRT